MAIQKKSKCVCGHTWVFPLKNGIYQCSRCGEKRSKQTPSKEVKMSHDIFEKGNLLVTAFVGPTGSACVQIGLQGDARYEQLTEAETRELAKSLMARVQRKPGFRATD